MDRTKTITSLNVVQDLLSKVEALDLMGREHSGLVGQARLLAMVGFPRESVMDLAASAMEVIMKDMSIRSRLERAGFTLVDEPAGSTVSRVVILGSTVVLPEGMSVLGFDGDVPIVVSVSST